MSEEWQLLDPPGSQGQPGQNWITVDGMGSEMIELITQQTNN